MTIYLAYKYPATIVSITNPIYFVTASAGIYVYYRFSKDLSSSKALTFLGKNSLIIFGLHALFANTYSYTKIQNYFIKSWSGLIVYIISIIYIITCCVIICQLYNDLKNMIIRRLSHKKTVSF